MYIMALINVNTDILIINIYTLDNFKLAEIEVCVNISRSNFNKQHSPSGLPGNA